MPRSHAALDEQLCFALYRASRAVSNAYARALKDHDLTYTQYLVLLALWENNGARVGDLSEVLGLGSNTLSPILRRLEQTGLLIRDHADADERVTRLLVTELGWQLEQAVQSARRSVESTTGLTKADFVDLRTRLFKLADNVSANFDSAASADD